MPCLTWSSVLLCWYHVVETGAGLALSDTGNTTARTDHDLTPAEAGEAAPFGWPPGPLNDLRI